MRRLPVVAALVALLLLAAPVSAMAAGPGSDAIVLAAAAEGEPLGPDPMERTAEDNAARELAGYEDMDLPYTWGAAWILTFAGFAGLALFGGLYHLLVRHPARGRSS